MDGNPQVILALMGSNIFHAKFCHLEVDLEVGLC